MRTSPSVPLAVAACLLQGAEGRLGTSDGEDATAHAAHAGHGRRLPANNFDFDFDRHRRSAKGSKSRRSGSSKSGKASSRYGSKGGKSESHDRDEHSDRTSSRDDYRPPGQRTVLEAADDAFVDRSDPNENFNLDYLEYGRNVDALVKFDLSRLDDRRLRHNLYGAELQLYSLEDCRSEMHVQVVAGEWDEDRVTWRTAPDHYGPKSSQPRVLANRMEEDEWAEVDARTGVLWSVEVMDLSYVTFRISTSGSEEGCELASKEYRSGRYAPTLELQWEGGGGGGKYGKHGAHRPGRRPQKRPGGRKPNKRGRMKVNHANSQSAATSLAESIAAGIAKRARRNDPCDARYGRDACVDDDCACMVTREVEGRGSAVGVCAAKVKAPRDRPRPEPTRAEESRTSTITVTTKTYNVGSVYVSSSGSEGDACRIEEYYSGEQVCMAGLACYHLSGATYGDGTCTFVAANAADNRPCYLSAANACRSANYKCVKPAGAASTVHTGMCTLSPNTNLEYRSDANNSDARSSNRGVWKVDYSRGGEGQCFLSDSVEVWEEDEVYGMAAECCDQKLWWMSERRCLGCPDSVACAKEFSRTR